jgi:Zn ribbon nucleic-acid-binding protein
MMHTRQAVCIRCDHTFTIHEETGSKAHLLHCVRCGRDKRIRLSDLKEWYHQHLSSLHSPIAPTASSTKETVRPLFADDHIDIRKYQFMVEHLAGSCICGAVFRFSAKPRCPKCRSTVIQTAVAKQTHARPALCAGEA